MVNGAGGEIGEYWRPRNASPKWRLPAQRKWVKNYAIRHAKHYSGDAGAGRQTPNIFFADVMDEEDAFFDKAWKALHCLPLTRAKFAPVQAVFSAGVYLRTLYGTRHPPCRSIRSGNPLDSVTQMGAQVSHGNWKPSSTTLISVKKRALMCHRRATQAAGRRTERRLLPRTTILFGQNNMRVFQEEIFGPCWR